MQSTENAAPVQARQCLLSEERGAQLVFAVLLAISGLTGCAFLGSAFLPDTALHGMVVSATPDGDPGFLNPAFLRILRLALGAAGLACFGAAAVLRLWLREQSLRAASFLLKDGRVLLERITGDIRTAGDSRFHRMVLYSIVAIGVAMRLAYLTQSIRHDEARTYLTFVSKGVVNILTNYYAPNNHILHNLMVYLTTSLFGDGPVALRLPAFLAGCLILPAAYLFARLLFDKNTALLTTGLLAVWPAMIEYSVNARGYTLVTLVCLLLFVLGYYLKVRSQFVAWSAYAVLGTLGLYTIPIMAYGLGIVSLWVLISAERGNRVAVFRGMAWTTVATIAMTTLLYLPPMLRSGWQTVIGNPSLAPGSMNALVGDAPDWLNELMSWWTRDVPAALLIAVGVGLAVSLRPYRVCRGSLVLALSAVGWIVGFELIHRGVPPVRVMFFLLPITLALASRGLATLIRTAFASLPRREFAVGALALVTCSYLSAALLINRTEISSERDSCPDASRVVATLKPLLEKGDLIVAAYPASAPVHYHLRREGLPDSFLQPFTGKERDKPILSHHRIFMVIRKGRYELEHLKMQGVDWRACFTTPEPVADYPTARVLLLRSNGHCGAWTAQEGSR